MERERKLSRINGFVLAVPPGIPASLNRPSIKAGGGPRHLILPFFIKEKSLLGTSICRWPPSDCRGTGGDWRPEREPSVRAGGGDSFRINLRTPGCWGGLITWVSGCRHQDPTAMSVSVEKKLLIYYCWLCVCVWGAVSTCPACVTCPETQ